MKRLFILAVITVLMVGTIQKSYADEFVFADGAGEAAPGTAFSTATRDNEVRTLLVEIGFSCLLGIATVSQFHGATAPATAEVTNQVPKIVNSPLGLTSGSLNLTTSTIGNTSFITTNTGDSARAESALFIGTTQGRDLIDTNQIPGVEHGVVPAVPEPATLLLLGSGLVGLASFVRRRLKGKDT